jgi:hypothetical protein
MMQPEKNMGEKRLKRKRREKNYTQHIIKENRINWEYRYEHGAVKENRKEMKGARRIKGNPHVILPNHGVFLIFALQIQSSRYRIK